MAMDALLTAYILFYRSRSTHKRNTLNINKKPLHIFFFFVNFVYNFLSSQGNILTGRIFFQQFFNFNIFMLVIYFLNVNSKIEIPDMPLKILSVLSEGTLLFNSLEHNRN